MQFPSYMHHLKKTVFYYNPQKCAKLCIKFNLQLKFANPYSLKTRSEP